MLRTKVNAKEGHVEIAVSGSIKDVVADLALITLHVKEQIKEHGGDKAETLLVMTLSGILLDIEAEEMIKALMDANGKAGKDADEKSDGAEEDKS